jgi:Flp pilus assembly protein TadD
VSSAPPFELLLASGEDDGAEALAQTSERPGTDALAAMKRAAEAHPEDPDYWFMLASALAQRGEHAAAVGAFREALRFPTRVAAYRRSLGTSLWQLGRFEEARQAFDETFREHPEDAEAANGLALSLLRLERPAEAVATLRRISGRKHERASWRSNLGAALWAAGDRAEAERCFRRAIRSQPREPAFHRNLGLVLLARGKAARAAACFREALRIDPGRAAIVMDLGDALFATGRHAEAEAAYERGLALEPGAAASRSATQAAWQTIRVERARGELKAQAGPGWLSRAIWRGLDFAQHLERRLDVLGPRGRRVTTAALLLLIVLFGRVTAAVLPHYVAHHRLHDEVVRLSRMPTLDDGLVLRGVLEAVRRLGREAYVRAENVQVKGADGRRRVTFGYAVEVELLPGLVTRLRFGIRVEEPFVVERTPVIL